VPADFTLLQLARDCPLAGVEADAAGVRLTLSAPTLVGALGGARYLQVLMRPTAPLMLQPWIGGPPTPLIDAAGRFDLTLLDVVVRRDAPPTLELAATPRDDLTTPVNGGEVALSGDRLSFATDAGRVVDEAALRAAATSAVASQLGRAPDLKRDLAALVASSVEPVLVGAEFRKSGARYYRATAEVAQTITLSLGRFSTPLGAPFSFDLSVFPGRFGETPPGQASLLARGGPPISRPMASIWNRPGQQYVLRSDGQADGLGRRLAHDFGALATPWLEALTTVDGMVEFLTREGGEANLIHAALILGRVGRSEEARRRIEEAGASWETTCEAARRYRIDLG
jgi:hypothetical protein